MKYREIFGRRCYLLAELVRGALVVQKRRRPTKPTRASKEERIHDKRKRSETKRMRRGDAD